MTCVSVVTLSDSCCVALTIVPSALQAGKVGATVAATEELASTGMNGKRRVMFARVEKSGVYFDGSYLEILLRRSGLLEAVTHEPRSILNGIHAARWPP